MNTELSPGRIDLWLLPTATEIAAPVIAEYRAMLSEAERLQEQRFHFERDRRRYLLTRALVRCMLSRYSSVAPRDWTFTRNAYGRPRIANDAAPAIEFNVSHTGDLIVLAIAGDCRLGVDCESLARGDCVSLAESYFAAPEVAALHALAPAGRQRRFLELWTLKESYIKARGMGLSIPLDEFSFDLSDSDIALSVDASLDEAGARWQFMQFLAAPDHIAAVCVDAHDGRLPEFQAYRAIPLISASALRIEPLRVSRGIRPPHFSRFVSTSDIPA
jgi:4'-phosphopantetheinyl transferase